MLTSPYHLPLRPCATIFVRQQQSRIMYNKDWNQNYQFSVCICLLDGYTWFRDRNDSSVSMCHAMKTNTCSFCSIRNGWEGLDCRHSSAFTLVEKNCLNVHLSPWSRHCKCSNGIAHGVQSTCLSKIIRVKNITYYILVSRLRFRGIILRHPVISCHNWG